MNELSRFLHHRGAEQDHPVFAGMAIVSLMAIWESFLDDLISEAFGIVAAPPFPAALKKLALEQFQKKARNPDDLVRFFDGGTKESFRTVCKVIYHVYPTTPANGRCP